MQGNDRITWIDGWKGVLIFLVVLGHVVGGAFHASSGAARATLGFLYRAIYIFHMPAFFMVAGYLWREHHGPYMHEIIRKAKRLIMPYFLWGFFSAVIFVILSSWMSPVVLGDDGYYGKRMLDFPWWRPFLSIIHAGDWPRGEGFRCNSVLWFLPCMFVVLVVYGSFQRLVLKISRSLIIDILLFVVCVILGAVMRFYVPKYLPWGINRVPYLMSFFILGRICHDTGVMERCRTKGLWGMVGFIIYFLGVLGYRDLSLGYVTWGWYFYSFVISVGGCVLSFYIAKLMPENLCKMVGALGVASLGIMLVHKFLIMPVHPFYKMIVSHGASTAVFLIGAISVTITLLAFGIALIIKKISPWMIGEK